MNKKTLVIGASLNTERSSYNAVRKLQENGHEVVAYGFRQGEINGTKINTEMVKFKDLDSITLYLSPRRQKAYYDYIINLNPKRVIFNPGTENPELYKHLTENDIQVDVACTLVLLSTNQY